MTESVIAEARPVQQVNNPVKPPEWVQWGVKIRPEVKERLSAFCERNEFSMQDTIDVALQDYMDLFERSGQ